jgi:hypothetical protein
MHRHRDVVALGGAQAFVLRRDDGGQLLPQVEAEVDQ